MTRVRTPSAELRESVLLILVAALVALPSPAMGQGTPETKQGTLTLANTGMGIGELPLPAPQRRAAVAGEDALMAVLRRDPALARPVGYGVVMHRSEGRTIAAKALGLPFDYGITSFVWYYGWDDNGRGGRTIEMNNGRFDFTVLVNGTGEGADINEPLGADGLPSSIRGYRKTGTFRGHPVYDGECVLITRSGLPPLVPVTRERYLREKILHARQDSTRHVAQQKSDGATPMSDHYAQYLKDKPKREADMKKTYDEIRKIDPASADKMMEEWRKSEAENEKQIRAASGGADMDRHIQEARAQRNAAAGDAIKRLQDQLDAMSAAERGRQAFVIDLGAGQTRLANDDETDATPLVQVNAAAYDKRLAAEIPQVVSVCLPGLQSDYQRQDSEWTPQRARDAALIRDGLDWVALEALVKPRS